MLSAQIRFYHSEYMLSDVTQIDESVHKTDEAVVPELVRRKSTQNILRLPEVTKFSFGEEIKA